MAIVSVHGFITYLTFGRLPDAVVVFAADWFDDCPPLLLAMMQALRWGVVLMVVNVNLLQVCYSLRSWAAAWLGVLLVGTFLRHD